jgi:sugar phosphate permease
VPRHDPPPRPPATLTDKLKRALRLLGVFAFLIAIIATLLVMRGQATFQIHMMIATFVGMGLVVFLGGALMLLIFYSAASGHDEIASRYDPEDKE